MSKIYRQLRQFVPGLHRGSVREQYLYPLLLAVVALNIITALITAGSLYNFAEARNAARKSTDINTQLADVYSSLRDAESGQRGYIITGNTSYLEPYYSGSKAAPRYVKSLRSELADTPQDKQETAELTELTQQKLNELSETVRLRSTQGFGAAAAVVDTNVGQTLMNHVHTLLTTMEQQVNAKTAARDRQANIFAIVAYGSLAVMIILTAAFVYFIRLVFQQVKDQGQKLELTVIELERSNRELQDFASVASHDLQEPLRKIQAFGDRLASTTKLSADSNLYLERMLDAAGRMRVLIDDLLTYSRVTTKAQPFKQVNLKRILSEVTSDLEVRIEETGTKITAGKLPAIEADPTQMRQIFQNLIANAIKFRAPDTKPHITIRSTIQTVNNVDTVSITVADNGIGFDEKYSDRIFTIFQRLHGRNEYEGTGVGLAVVRKIAERHGGTVIAKSEVGKGSQFIVTLPIKHKSTSKGEKV